MTAGPIIASLDAEGVVKRGFGGISDRLALPVSIDNDVSTPLKKLGGFGADAASQ